MRLLSHPDIILSAPCVFIQFDSSLKYFIQTKEFSHGKEMMQILEFQDLIGGLYYHITKKSLAWICSNLAFYIPFWRWTPSSFQTQLSTAWRNQRGTSNFPIFMLCTNYELELEIVYMLLMPLLGNFYLIRKYYLIDKT